MNEAGSSTPKRASSPSGTLPPSSQTIPSAEPIQQLSEQAALELEALLPKQNDQGQPGVDEPSNTVLEKRTHRVEMVYRDLKKSITAMVTDAMTRHESKHPELPKARDIRGYRIYDVKRRFEQSFINRSYPSHDQQNRVHVYTHHAFWGSFSIYIEQCPQLDPSQKYLIQLAPTNIEKIILCPAEGCLVALFLTQFADFTFQYVSVITSAFVANALNQHPKSVKLDKREEIVKFLDRYYLGSPLEGLSRSNVEKMDELLQQLLERDEREGVRGQYRRATELPDPTAPANTEFNRHRKQVGVRLSEHHIEKLKTIVANLGKGTTQSEVVETAIDLVAKQLELGETSKHQPKPELNIP